MSEFKPLEPRNLGHFTDVEESHIPQLEPHCGSWIVTRKDDGSVIGEFFDRNTLAIFNPATCKIETSATYLARVNQQLKNNGETS